MLFSTPITFLAVLASAVVAAPLEARQSGTWTMKAFTRTCSTTANTCVYSYGINLNNGTPSTQCKYTVAGSPSTPAARQSYNSVACGAFTIGSSWSGQFGPGNGFQVLSVVKAGKIIYPGYTDNQLVSGKTVSPDQSYTPQPL